MKRLMKTLSNHNEERERQLEEQFLLDKEDDLAGVFCDVCYDELYYSEPRTLKLSHPPTEWVFCLNTRCSEHKKKKPKIR